MVSDMDNLLAALRAAGETTRLRILGLLGHGELTVSELVQILRQSQPRVSRHLKLMVEAGLLSRFREGTWVFYRLADSGIQKKLTETLLQLIEDKTGDIDRDLERLAWIRSERATSAQAYFKENAEKWDEIRSLYISETSVESALKKMVGNNPIDALLDIGTGTGRMLELFSGQVHEAVGIDLSRDMLAIARESISSKGLDNCQVRIGDMYQLPVDAQSQDLILFHQVLHYCDEPAQAIKEASKALKEGGAMVIADFAPHDLEFLRDDHAHRRLGFTTDEVKVWANSSGLIVAKMDHLAGEKLNVCIWRLEKPKTNIGVENDR